LQEKYYKIQNNIPVSCISKKFINKCTVDTKHLSSFLQMLKKIDKKIIKLTVFNTGQVMFSGEIYYYWPLIQLKKIVSQT